MRFVRLRWEILLVLAAASVAIALAWLLAPRRAQRERLLEAVRAEERSADLRPSHVVAPLPGTFGELLEPHLPALHESYETYKRLGAAGKERVKRICAGQDPIAQIAPEVSADLALHRAAMQGALRATHAESARAPASFRVFAFFKPRAPFVDVQQAAWLGVLDMLSLLEHGRTDEAVDECADVLALGRDISYPIVLGRIFGVGITLFSAPACGLALSAARAADLDGARAKLFAIRRGTPRFADILQRESLFQQLLLADPDPRLPEAARAFIAEAQKLNGTGTDRLVIALLRTTALESQAALMAALVDTQRLDWPACADRMKEVAHRSDWNPLVRLVRLDRGFVDLLRRHRDGFLELDALACATSVSLERARTGALPRDAASACPPIEPEAKCGEQSAPLRILDDGNAPRVAVTLSDGSDYTVPLARLPKGRASGPVSPH